MSLSFILAVKLFGSWLTTDMARPILLTLMKMFRAPFPRTYRGHRTFLADDELAHQWQVAVETY